MDVTPTRRHNEHTFVMLTLKFNKKQISKVVMVFTTHICVVGLLTVKSFSPASSIENFCYQTRPSTDLTDRKTMLPYCAVHITQPLVLIAMLIFYWMSREFAVHTTWLAKQKMGGKTSKQSFRIARQLIVILLSAVSENFNTFFLLQW